MSAEHRMIVVLFKIQVALLTQGMARQNVSVVIIHHQLMAFVPTNGRVNHNYPKYHCISIMSIQSSKLYFIYLQQLNQNNRKFVGFFLPIF